MMASISSVLLVILMFFICGKSYEDKDQELTDFKVNFEKEKGDHFPAFIPFELIKENQTIRIVFQKWKYNFDIPVYTRTNDGKNIRLDIPPITDVRFYTNETYDGSIMMFDTCDKTTGICTIGLATGFFTLDGYRHVIKPTERSVRLPEKERNPKVQSYQVFKIHEANYTHSKCGLAFKNYTAKSTLKYNEKKLHTIEVAALITLKSPYSDKDIEDETMYYIHIFWGVNNIFEKIKLNDLSFEVKLVGVIIEPADTTELYNGYETRGWSQGTRMLNLLMSKFKKIYPCDHLTMFSIYKFCANKCGKNPELGLAFIGTMCRARSVSIVRKSTVFREMTVIAHEIGHSLGMNDDGRTNECSVFDGYIMAYAFYEKIIIQKNNYGKFSSCSYEALKKYMITLNNFGNCLLTRDGKEILLDVKKMPNGQMYTLEEQCKANAKFKGRCKNTSRKNIVSICHGIDCQLKGNDSCDHTQTFYRTSCGNKKWCENGKCVYNPEAPAVLPSVSAKLKSGLHPIVLAMLHLSQLVLRSNCENQNKF